jgi:7-cyano-7-deazaguanine synthase
MTEDKDLQLVKVLWTGGFDSTCRMLQLSKLNVKVQPYYLLDHRYRRSIVNELNAISAITKDIITHHETRCIFLPLIKVEVADIEEDQDITLAYKRLREKVPLGHQYDWLARFAKSNPGLEMSFEKDESAKLYHFLKKYEVMRRVDEGEIKYYIIDDSKCENDIVKVFGSFHFPYPLLLTTKKEMVGEYKDLGFEETINKTWFCHTPIKNEPCGVCSPCRIAIKEGLTFRFPVRSLKRYQAEIRLERYSIYDIIKKIRYRLAGY